MAGEIQQKLKEFGPVLSTAIPAYGDTAEVAIGTVVNPAISELNKLVSSPETKTAINGLALLGATARQIGAEARMSDAVLESVNAVSLVKATNAMSQYKAFVQVGFSPKDAMSLLQQMLMVDAVRDAKAKPSFPDLSKGGKEKK